MFAKSSANISDDFPPSLSLMLQQALKEATLVRLAQEPLSGLTTGLTTEELQSLTRMRRDAQTTSSSPSPTDTAAASSSAAAHSGRAFAPVLPAPPEGEGIHGTFMDRQLYEQQLQQQLLQQQLLQQQQQQQQQQQLSHQLLQYQPQQQPYSGQQGPYLRGPGAGTAEEPQFSLPPHDLSSRSAPISRIHAHPYLSRTHYHYHTSPHHHGGDPATIAPLTQEQLYQSLGDLEDLGDAGGKEDGGSS